MSRPPARCRPPNHLPDHVLGRADFADACARRDLGAVLKITKQYGGPGFTASHIARLCELTPSRVQDYVKGRRLVISAEVMERIVDGLHIPGQMLGLAPRDWERDEPFRRGDHPLGGEQTVADLCDALTSHDVPETARTVDFRASLRNLQRDLDVVFADFQRSRFQRAAGRARSLLSNSQFLAHLAAGEHEREQASQALALTYHATSSVLVKLGQPDLSLLAAERGLRSSTQCESVTTSWSLRRAVAFALLANGRLTSTMRLIDTTVDAISRQDIRSGAEISTFGTLLLVGSLAAARFGDRGRAGEYLNEAEAAANRLGRDANYAWTAFGPTNVAIHRTNIAAELGDMHAIVRSPSIAGLRSVPAERQVRYLLDVARARHTMGRADAALGTLLNAERIAPEHVHQHYLGRRLVDDLVRDVKGRPTTELADLARRMQKQAT